MPTLTCDWVFPGREASTRLKAQVRPQEGGADYRPAAAARTARRRRALGIARFTSVR